MSKVVFTAGAWDLFHIGHLNFLTRAKAYGDRLVVGVMTDEAIYRSHGRYPIVPFAQRMGIVEGLRCVDRVGAHNHPKDYWGFDHCGATIRAVGPQYFKTIEHIEAYNELTSRGIKYVFIPRTPDVSTTQIKEKCYEQTQRTYRSCWLGNAGSDYHRWYYPHPPAGRTFGICEHSR